MALNSDLARHLECLNQARAKALALKVTIDRCIRQADKLLGYRPRSNGNGGKKTGTR